MMGESKQVEFNYQLDEQIGFVLRRAHQFASGIFQERMSSFSLTPPQFSALVTIDRLTRNPTTRATDTPSTSARPISQNELGRLIDTDRATVQGIVKRLKERDYIVVSADPDHKRKLNLSLTTKGQTLVDKVIPIAAGVSTETLANLTIKEQQELSRLLLKMVQPGH